MAKPKERTVAKNLRANGVSIAAIAQKLSVSKSTVSVWCRDINLSEEAIKKIIKTSQNKSTAGLIRYTEGLRTERQKRVAADMLRGKGKLDILSDRDIYCIGLGLYWGEGYKKGSQEFGFTNSDPAMIRFYLRWLAVVFGVEKQELIFRISINQQHRKRELELLQFWSKVTHAPVSQFTKTSFIKTASKKIYSNPQQHFGTLRVKVRRGTSMRREILGAIDAISEVVE